MIARFSGAPLLRTQRAVDVLGLLCVPNASIANADFAPLRTYGVTNDFT